MATVTKVSKPAAEYHTWTASELSNGDIIDVYASLGNRPAHTVTVESLGGASTIRFNVITEVFQNYGAGDQAAGMGDGLPRPWPRRVTEIEETTDDIVIEDSATEIWEPYEIGVRTIKIVSKSSGLKITVT